MTKKGLFASLNKKQREAIGLLQLGTFLEYFDLMLYVHMAVLLNELFFPKTDPHTAALLTAFAFCSTYVLRPFGALLFGWIGDNIGRKATVILTTAMMAISCIIMANLPTYAQIGIAASWVVTGCRIVQGLSSMGEIIGAQIYVAEMTDPPARYPTVALIACSSRLGTMVALTVTTAVLSFGIQWRTAFWIGACIAVVGSFARTRLRETPEFLASKLKKKKDPKAYAHDADNRLSFKNMLAFFLIYCGWPLTFYLVFMYFNPALKELGLSSQDIIYHNFYLSILSFIECLGLCFLSYHFHPLKMIKILAYLSVPLTLSLPWLIPQCTTPTHFFLLQTSLLIFSLCSTPSEAILLKAIPVLKRFTAASFLYALSRALIYIITSFSLVYLTCYFGTFGLLIIMLPLTLGFLWSVNHFETLEDIPEKSLPLNPSFQPEV